MALQRSTLMVGSLYAAVFGVVAWLVWPVAASPSAQGRLGASATNTSQSATTNGTAVVAPVAIDAQPAAPSAFAADPSGVPAPATGPMPAALSAAERERVVAAFRAAADQDVRHVSDALAAARVSGAPAAQVAALEARLATMKQTMGDVAARHPAP